MKVIIFVSLLLIANAFASKPAISMEMVNEINKANVGWTAGFNEKFASATIEDAKRLCGTRRTPAPKVEKMGHVDVVSAAIPDSFDARDQWPECPSIGHIRDQSACGSCWAFGTAEAASDRYCIAKKGTEALSATDLVGCCTDCGDGCQGGWPESAWSYIVDQGIVTGGDYHDGASCWPYPFPQCEHHFQGNGTKHYPDCPTNDYATPTCPRKCQSGYNTPWTSDKRKAQTSYSISSRPTAIQTEIMSNGPITVAFDVYEDFLTYRSGVYHHVKGNMLGGHAVRMLGWGVENNTPYWLVANSWNEDWGNQGYFRILRGKNECGIEGDCCAGKF